MATEFPLVSVVMATYNGDKYLETQLDSVLQQTYSNLEIIIVDDGSTDRTREILIACSKKFQNLTIVFNEENLGYVKNFEKGCQLATGDFIAFCDQDDYWLPHKIEKMLGAIGEKAMVYCNSLLCDEELKSTGICISDRANCRAFTNCLEQAVFCRIYGHATLIKRSLIDRAIPFLEVIPHDWWLSFLATLNGGIDFFPETLVWYRQHAQNIFGAVGSGTRKHNRADESAEKQMLNHRIRKRIRAFYDACPGDRAFEKNILHSLMKSYSNFSFSTNLKRMFLFFRNYKLLLASKKRSVLRKYLFCLKMFTMIK